jgi:hypothetical protein
MSKIFTLKMATEVFADKLADLLHSISLNPENRSFTINSISENLRAMCNAESALSEEIMLALHMEEGSNTSTVALRVVRGDE